MFPSHSLHQSSPFSEIALFLAERYEIPKEEIKSPLLELVIDGAISVELQEEKGSVYLIGTVVESILINKDKEALALLKLASSHLGLTEGTLAWDQSKQRIIFWLEVTPYIRETEFNFLFEQFLNHLDAWIALVPRTLH